MKKILYIFLAISIIFSSCKKEEGCTDPIALNYNADAEEDDGSCIPVVNGCTDIIALNYDVNANTDDGSCTYPPTFSLQVSGDTVISGDANEQLTSHLTVTNISNKTLDVRCRINPISQPSGSQFSFCWAAACYPVGTLVSGNTVTMTPGQVVTFPDLDAHSGYYNALGAKDIAEIEYCFYNDATLTDETCFTVTFNTTASE